MNQPNHAREYRPLIGGTAIYNPKNGVEGTLGLIATDGSHHWIVSAFHVLGRRPGAATVAKDGEPIWQPLDGSGTAAPVAALDLPRCNPLLDIAFARVLPGVTCKGWILGIGPIGPAAVPILHKRVIKSGLATGVTEGFIAHVDAQLIRIEPAQGFPQKYDLSSSADSGSVWIDAATRQPVGLHVRGQEGAKEAAYAGALNSALASAGLSVLT